MANEFSSQDREVVCNRSAASIAREMASRLKEIERDLFQAGKGAIDPKIIAAVRASEKVIDDVLDFDIRAAEAELHRIQVQQAAEWRNPFDEVHEQQLRQWFLGQLERQAKDILDSHPPYRPKLQQFVRQGGSQLIVSAQQMVKTDGLHRIDREYRTRRAAFELDAVHAYRPQSPEVPPQYDASLRSNKIDDPMPVMSSEQIAIALWGRDKVCGKQVETAKRRAREWMKAGRLPANRLKRGEYVVSKSALERLSQIEGGALGSSQS